MAIGAVALEASGACWALPQFLGRSESIALMRTLHALLTDELRPLRTSGDSLGGGVATAATNVLTAPALAAEEGVARSVLRDLWGSGGALSALALARHRRSPEVAASPGRLALLTDSINETAKARR